jgi:hypothetical protein
MSLLNKLEGLQAKVEAKKTTKDLEKGKDSLGGIIAKKNALSARINELNTVISELKQSYGQAEADLGSFKKTKGDIEGMYEKYEEALQEHGIKSASELLTNSEFANEPEVKEYFAKSPAKEKEMVKYAGHEEAQAAEGKRGRLGSSIQKLSQAKSRAKELMPEADLSFSGGKTEGQEISRRRESLIRMTDERDSLRRELDEVLEEEKKAEEGYMPKIEKLIETELNRLLPIGQERGTGSEVINRRFVPDQIFEVCGSFWPEAKKTIRKVIEKRFREREIKIDGDSINRSLEAEKILYDADRLKNEYGGALRMEYDSKALSHLDNKLDGPFDYNQGRAAFRSGRVVPEGLLSEAERLNNKNPEAKQMAEDALNKLRAVLLEERGKTKNGLLDSGRIKAEKDKVRERIDESLKKLDSIKAPDDFFKNNYWDFTNSLSNSKPYISEDKWANDMRDRLEKAYRSEIDNLHKLAATEQEAINKLSNKIYNSRSFGSSRNEFLQIGGFKIPAMNLEAEFAPSQGYRINDLARFESFFNSLDGQNMSKAEFQVVLKEAVDSYQKDINDVSGGREAIQTFDALRANNSDFIQHNYELLDAKMNNGRRSSDTKKPYEVENKIFKLEA